jgi:hypothetical protein
MDTGMQHRRGHAAWIWTRSMDIDMQRVLGHAACTVRGMQHILTMLYVYVLMIYDQLI